MPHVERHAAPESPKGDPTKPVVVKRSIVIANHKTSVSLENDFWISLKQIAAQRRSKLSELVAIIDKDRQGNLSSAIRLFVLDYYRTLASEDVGKVAPRQPLSTTRP